VRVVVFGASGNVGTSLLRRLGDDDRVSEILGVARRPPSATFAKTRWTSVDIVTDPLEGLMEGADAVVHLAWMLQPARRPSVTWATNVEGSSRILEAVEAAGVPRLVYASSVGAYSPGPKRRAVDESWATHGVATSIYSREKAYVERLVDTFEVRNPEVRVVRLRPGLIFKAEAASAIRRFFLGSLFPNALLQRVPVMPHLPGVRFQALHSADAADAYHLAVMSDDARGAYNLAADPVLDLAEVAEVAGARPVPVPRFLARPAASLTWHLRLQPVEPGWVDLALNAPLLDSGRARADLGWRPQHSATEAVAELLGGIDTGAGGPTPTLRADSAQSRAEELLRTRQGARYAAEGGLQPREGAVGD
jgi:UDP-glucose 4-epimerase